MTNFDMESCEWLIEHQNDPWVKNHRAERLKNCLEQQKAKQEAEDQRNRYRKARRDRKALQREVAGELKAAPASKRSSKRPIM
ncbi:hypothetical protein I5V32_03325 [Stenotrophomonas maltophilia]|uniref:hypothetical protein n=1 Tax=Stenotrophomonas TaxID=40323 RepID=UPI00128E2739|nr:MULTISPECIES: hypothetical protein [Stenotrophomonas]MBH1583039.1 hypothetical protein [Stenotrophomonas maltophilia]MBH1715183.1 hypothetical protein [Stenotrophomonas maltophilia]MCR1817198.1 hypothetical protein [Stenotrophomonas muris]MDG9972323.1 hypothetical protein [Stenotrophomonas sp. GD04032]